MKTALSTMLALGLFLCYVSHADAQARPTGKYVTVWLLEIKYKVGDPWHVAGKYDTYASAQQSYFVRARHGGYHEMRIRQTVEWRSTLRFEAMMQPSILMRSKK